MKASLASHCYKHHLSISTNSNNFKVNGCRIIFVTIDIEVGGGSLTSYYNLVCNATVETMEDSVKIEDYDLILSILEEAVAPESVINLVKYHRQQNENKKSS